MIVLSLSLFFMSLTLLNSIFLLSYSLSFTLGVCLFFFFFMIWLILCIFGKNALEGMLCLSQYVIPGNMMSLCCVTGDINLSHFVEVAPAGFFHCRVTNFPFIIDKYLGGGSYFSDFYTLILASLGGVCLQ